MGAQKQLRWPGVLEALNTFKEPVPATTIAANVHEPRVKLIRQCLTKLRADRCVKSSGTTSNLEWRITPKGRRVLAEWLVKHRKTQVNGDAPKQTPERRERTIHDYAEGPRRVTTSMTMVQINGFVIEGVRDGLSIRYPSGQVALLFSK